MKRSAVFLSALALAVSLTVSGCGGGDDKSSDAPASITKADFTEQADAICAAGDVTINAAADALGDTPTQAEIEAFATDVLVVSVQSQHDDIEALGAPDGDEDDITAMLDALQSSIDAVTADPASINAEGADPFADANQMAQDYGLTDCGAS